MSSTYSPITILDPNIHLRNTHHWPHVQYVQAYHYIISHQPLTEHTSLTTCPVRTVLSLYYIPPSTYEKHSTDHMSSTYSPFTILDPTTHLRNTQHWPHVQYVQSYPYIRSHHPVTKHTSLTTCPVRTVLSLYYIPPPTYETHITDHMSSTYSPITILDPTTHLRNTHHWPHRHYVQSYHYIRSHHPVTKHTSLTTCLVRTVLSLYYIPQPTYETHITDHMSSTYSPITILDPTTQLRNTHNWPHVQYIQSFRYIIACPVRWVQSLY